MHKKPRNAPKTQGVQLTFALLLCIFLILSGAYLADYQLRDMIYINQPETRYQESLRNSREQLSSIWDTYIRPNRQNPNEQDPNGQDPGTQNDNTSQFQLAIQQLLQTCREMFNTIKTSIQGLL